MKTQKFFSSVLLMSAFCLRAFATIHTVQVANFSFTPGSFSASVGDTVRWQWVSGSHTTTSTSVPSGAGTWDAPMNSSNPTFSYVILFAGTYNYKCTPHGFTGTFTATVAGIEENEVTNFLLKDLFPNPVVKDAHLVFETKESVNLILVVYDLSGKKVQEYFTKSEAGESKFEFDTSLLPAGNYIYSLVAGNKKITRKFSVVK